MIKHINHLPGVLIFLITAVIVGILEGIALIRGVDGQILSTVVSTLVGAGVYIATRKHYKQNGGGNGSQQRT